MSGYRNLIVWQEARNLTILIYRLTENFPRSEEFGLKGQMRRASVSVMSQIAEGWIRRSKKDKLHYIEIAEGSLLELESQGEVAKAVNYWDSSPYESFVCQQSKVAFLLYRYKKVIEK
ncbi:MAG: four helix bundle protein [bacterium]|nr:four helix bundle protein [bacterium]